MTLNPITITLRTLRGLFARDSAFLREALKAMKPEEIVGVLNNLDHREQMHVVSHLPDEKLAEILWDVSPHARGRLIARLPIERIMAVADRLESDDEADLIQMLDGRKRERVIEYLKRSDPKRVLPLLGFGQETAGGLMQSEVLRVEKEKTVEEARPTLAAALGSHKASMVYVTDADGRLEGAVSLIRFAASPPAARISDLMQRQVDAVPVATPQEDVVRIFAEHDLVEVPVVDGRGRLQGVITADDMLDVVERELSEDLSRFSGTSEDERISDPVWLSIKRRLPWLIINLATAVLAAWVVSKFEATIVETVALAALMPIVAGMGGNAITQTLGVSIRSIALRELQSLHAWTIILRQMLVGAANGIVTGLIAAAVVWLWSGNAKIALVLLAAMIINLFIAGLGGVAIPIFMKRMRIDPALASTVFATTLTDVVGFFAFLGLAAVLL